jgi:hypothetical protein
MEEKALVTISTKSWHYILMKLVLGSTAPTPQNMHNLCPYFWLLVLCILTFWFVLPIKYIFILIKWLFDGLANFTERFMLVPAADNWYNRLTDMDIYQIYYQNREIKGVYKYAYGDEDNFISITSFIQTWWQKKYGKNMFMPGAKAFVYTQDFIDWCNKMQKEWENLTYREPSKFHKNVSNFWDNVDEKILNIRATVISYSSLIKWTKRIVGIIITCLGLVATYFVVNFSGRGILYVLFHWNWSIFFSVLIWLGIIGVAILLFILLKGFISLIAEKKLKLWYVKIFYYPLYYLVYWPLRIILYTVLWNLILVNLWFVVKNGAKLIWGSLLGFLGIFGEYFGASYSDYCPGIEWKEDKK